MSSKPPLHALSIFLVKKSVKSYDDAIRDPESLRRYEIARSSGVRGIVVTRAPQGKPPWWSAFLAPHVTDGNALKDLANTSTAALLLLTAGNRRFGFAFGYGRHLLDPEAYEQDFGLKVVLNTVEPDELRSVDARTFDELTIHTRRDLSRGASFGAFGFDVSRDVVRAVTGPPRDATLGQRATGSDALALMTRADFGDLPALCKRLLAAYEAEDYKERFPWIDHLRPVRDPEVVRSLDAMLVETIRERELTDVHLAPPEPVDWTRLAGFTFSTRGRDENELDADPRITAYLETLTAPEDVTVEELKAHRVVAVGAEADEVVGRWPVYRCMVFEARRDDVLYALTGGQWYSVSASFAEEVERFARELPELDLDLPAASVGVAEAEYNSNAARSVDALCLDQQLVRTSSGDRVELCDLFTRSGTLVHIKKRGASSTLSHLFSQGLVSAELMAREPEFRAEARRIVQALDESYAQAIRDGRPSPETSEVGYVVITRSRRDTPLTLPFFSLVNLRSAAQRLQDLGYRVSARQVPEE